MSQVSFAVSTVSQTFPSDPGIASYRFGLHDQAGAEVQAQAFMTPPASVMFDVPPGTGWTVRGSQVTSAGALVGAVVETAPFDVEAVTRVVIGSIQMLVG